MTDRELDGARDEVRPWYDAVTVPWLLAAVLRGRKVIVALAIAGFVTALAVALVRTTYYTSTFAFIPAAGGDQSRGGLASIAGQIGINIGSLGNQGQSPDLYADLLRTHDILADVAQDTVVGPDGRRVPVAVFVDAKGSTPAVRLENAIRILRDKIVTTSVASRTTGMVTVNVRTPSPAASYAIAQRLLDGLNRFNLQTRRTQAGQERQFVEQRLAEARVSLRRSEDALQNFLQGNRAYGGSPELAFQKDRLERDVTLQQQLVTDLAQQFEEARIREVRDTPVITVLQAPLRPVLPDPGGRAMTVILGTFVAVMIGVVIVVARAGWERQRRVAGDEQSYASLSDEWHAVRAGFGRRA